MLLVVAFHANAALVPGGFVGVDVFFVISGYVISRLLLAQSSAGGVSLAHFYARRACRILPALVVVAGTSLAAGLVVLGPHDLRQMARSVVALLLFSANIFFWRHRGYFEDQGAVHPLLHTWSLGVEEQFYLIVPLLLFVVQQTSNLRFRWAAIACAASLVLGVWMTGSHPAAAFYLLPTRAWQLLLGVLLALSKSSAGPQAMLAEVSAAAGLLAILVSAVSFTGTTPYPGIAALLPCVGTALVIVATGQSRTFVGRMLEWRGLVAVGLASYSAYLWHWPAFALSRSHVGRELTGTETALVLAATAALSYLSWRYVEQPFRGHRRSMTAGSARLLILAGAMTCVAMLAVAIIAAQGFPGRVPAMALQYERSSLEGLERTVGCHKGIGDPISRDSVCTIAVGNPGGTRVLLWGDSHANALVPVMASLGADAGAHVWQASYSSCPPLIAVDVAHQPKGHRCRAFNSMVLEAIKRLRIQRVVLAGYWQAYWPSAPDALVARLFDPFSPAGALGGGDEAANRHAFEEALRRTVDEVAALGARVFVVRQVPAQHVFVPLLVSRTVMRGDDPAALGISRQEHQRSNALIDSVFDALTEQAELLDPADALCASGKCICVDSDRVLYSDTNHLSLDGAMFVRPVFQRVFE